MKYIDEEGIYIKHLCSTKPGMSGSPIINLNNFNIIGIHKGSEINPKLEFNWGIYLREPIKHFYEFKIDNIIKIENSIEKK